ncbi:hypothetical protein [Dolosigranulum savutiense]|uniref:Lipoprotein n=1 Tax=Dolosigranulum savutiense TaxID=3110288 RepID=A0AB74U938_9LACT
MKKYFGIILLMLLILMGCSAGNVDENSVAVLDESESSTETTRTSQEATFTYQQISLEQPTLYFWIERVEYGQLKEVAQEFEMTADQPQKDNPLHLALNHLTYEDHVLDSIEVDMDNYSTYHAYDLNELDTTVQPAIFDYGVAEWDDGYLLGVIRYLKDDADVTSMAVEHLTEADLDLDDVPLAFLIKMRFE